MTNDAFIAGTLTKGWFFLGRERYREAIAAGHEVLSQQPEHADALFLCGMAGLLLPDAGFAENMALSLLHSNPDSPRAHYLMGLVQHELMGNTVAAERSFRTMIELDPGSPDGYAILGRFLAVRRRREEGITVARKGLKLDPNNLSVLKALQTLYRLNEEPELAEEFGRRALEQDPEDAEQHLEAGLRLLEGGKRSHSVRSFRESLRLQPVDGENREIIAHEKARTHPFFKNGIFLSFRPSILIPALCVPLVWYGLSLLFRPFLVLVWLSVGALAACYGYHALFLLHRRRIQRSIDRGRL